MDDLYNALNNVVVDISQYESVDMTTEEKQNYKNSILSKVSRSYSYSKTFAKIACIFFLFCFSVTAIAQGILFLKPHYEKMINEKNKDYYNLNLMTEEYVEAEITTNTSKDLLDITILQAKRGDHCCMFSALITLNDEKWKEGNYEYSLELLPMISLPGEGAGIETRWEEYNPKDYPILEKNQMLVYSEMTFTQGISLEYMSELMVGFSNLIATDEVGNQEEILKSYHYFNVTMPLTTDRLLDKDCTESIMVQTDNTTFNVSYISLSPSILIIEQTNDKFSDDLEEESYLLTDKSNISLLFDNDKEVPLSAFQTTEEQKTETFEDRVYFGHGYGFGCIIDDNNTILEYLELSVPINVKKVKAIKINGTAFPIHS